MKHLFIISMTFILFIQCKSTKNMENNLETTESKTEKVDKDMYKTAWVWRHTQYTDKRIVPREKDKFTIKFDKERLDITTDCNGMSATYQMFENKLKLTEFISTRMFCLDSQESEFSHMLQLAEMYEISKNGNVLNIILNEKAMMVFENLNK